MFSISAQVCTRITVLGTHIILVFAGEWARILPAGDPGSSNPGGTPVYPSARQGAVGLTFTEALVGNSRGNATDSIVFGGVDAE